MELPGIWDWNIAVFCQNEQDTITNCLAAIEQASAGRRVLVCLIVNGSSDESGERAAAYAANCHFDFLLARIEAGDKSNAINAFNYVLRVPARTYIYIDGYVTFAPASLAGLSDCLDRRPGAVAATGVSVNGRTMKDATQATLQAGGILHGQLHAFRPSFIDRMVARGIRIPLGHYSGDGLLGSMAAHDLDALGQPWENARIAGVAEAQYEIKQLSPFKLQDVRRQFRRMIRQARGRMQNLAVKDLIYQHNYDGLPLLADDMLKAYLAKHGPPRVPLRRRPFLAMALRQLKNARPPPPQSLRPSIAASSDPGLVDHIRSKTGLSGAPSGGEQ